MSNNNGGHSPDQYDSDEYGYTPPGSLPPTNKHFGLYGTAEDEQRIMRETAKDAQGFYSSAPTTPSAPLVDPEEDGVERDLEWKYERPVKVEKFSFGVQNEEEMDQGLMRGSLDSHFENVGSGEEDANATLNIRFNVEDFMSDVEFNTFLKQLAEQGKEAKKKEKILKTHSEQLEQRLQGTVGYSSEFTSGPLLPPRGSRRIAPSRSNAPPLPPRAERPRPEPVPSTSGDHSAYFGSLVVEQEMEDFYAEVEEAIRKKREEEEENGM